jgi:DNA-binding beta-propeller fold protein YncE
MLQGYYKPGAFHLTQYSSRYLFSIAAAILVSTHVLSAQTYKITGSIPVGGAAAWDYLMADSQAHLLYVSHGTEVVVIDTASKKVIGSIGGMKRIHGITLDKSQNIGFISDGGSNEVAFFDLKTLAVTKKVKAGTNPDGIVYDSFSHRVFAFNGGTKDATVIEAASGKVAGTIALGGKPEFPVADGKGSIYDNIEDKSEIVWIDSKTLAVKAHWPLAPCESPSGLAFDPEKRRLFAVCDNKMMAIVDADSGKVLATPAIGEGPDAAAFDPGTKLIFSSDGESGTLTVLRESGKNHFSMVQTLPTKDRSRTMTIDAATHKIYLPSADFVPAPKPAGGEAPKRPAAVPDTFKILVLETTR